MRVDKIVTDKGKLVYRRGEEGREKREEREGEGEGERERERGEKG